MTEEQKKTVGMVEKISQMIQSGKMPLELCPVSELKTALCCALSYKENVSLAEEMAEGFCDILENQILAGERWGCQKIVELMAKCMESAFDIQSYYVEKIVMLQNEFQRAQGENELYQNIVRHYREGKIDEKFLSDHTCQSLVAIKKKGEIELFKEISQCVYKVALQQIQRKKNKKIVFFLKDSAEWSCEELYHKVAEMPGIETSIVVAPFYVGTSQTIMNTYVNTIKYFQERGYDTVGLYNLYQGRYMSWKEIGVPDIIFHLNPHYTAFRESSNICNFPLSILNIYIPYGVLIYGNVEHQFNQISHLLFWKTFCETPLHKKMAEKYSDIGDSNVVYSGYVKMDSIYETQEIDEKAIWKVPFTEDEKRVKRIIYAPHWSVKDSFTGFGNFDKIYKELYQYAKEHQETTSWVFRPHPMLRAGVVQQGIFSSEQAYDEYLKMWNQLPNARVIEDGLYIDIFKTSDAMILDSVSFLAEYLYLHKPMLFLTRERNTFNDFGKELIKVLYKVDGGDFQGIERFMEEVVVKGNDDMLEEREKFFREYMDYKEQNGMIASDYICEYIKRQINNEVDVN